MDKSTWITIGAIGAGIGLAIYLGSQAHPTASDVTAQTMNTQSIDTNNALTSTVLTDLTTQQQIMNNLHLGSPQATPVSSSTTTGGTMGPNGVIMGAPQNTNMFNSNTTPL